MEYNMDYEFNTKEEAQEWNHQEALSRGCNGVTKYWYSMQDKRVSDAEDAEIDYTTLTKEEYATLKKLSLKVEDEEGKLVDNPELKKKTYKTPKVIVKISDGKYEKKAGKLKLKEVVNPEEDIISIKK